MCIIKEELKLALINGMKVIAVFLIIHCVISLLPQYNEDRHLKVVRRIFYSIWIVIYIIQIVELYGTHISILKNIAMYAIVTLIYIIIGGMIDYFAICGNSIWDIFEKINEIRKKK